MAGTRTQILIERVNEIEECLERAHEIQVNQHKQIAELIKQIEELAVIIGKVWNTLLERTGGCTNTVRAANELSTGTPLTLLSISGSECSSGSDCDCSESTPPRSEETSEKQAKKPADFSAASLKDEALSSEPSKTERESTDDTSPSSSTAKQEPTSTSTPTSSKTDTPSKQKDGSESLTNGFPEGLEAQRRLQDDLNNGLLRRG